MTIEDNLARITELLEVITEVIVDKAFTTEADEYCDEQCLCDSEDDYGDNGFDEGYSVLSSISAPVQFHGAEALALVDAVNKSDFTTTADFIRYATLAYIDATRSGEDDSFEDDSSDNEASIEFVSDGGEIIGALNAWLGQQIHWSWQNRKNAEANAFELTFDKLQRFLKGER